MKWLYCLLLLITPLYAGVDGTHAEEIHSPVESPEPLQAAPAPSAQPLPHAAPTTVQKRQSLKQMLTIKETIRRYKKQKKIRRKKESAGVFLVMTSLVLGALATLGGLIGGLSIILAGVYEFAGTTAMIGGALTGFATYALFAIALAYGYGGSEEVDWPHVLAMLGIYGFGTFAIGALFKLGWFATQAAMNVMLIAGLAALIFYITLAIVL